MSAIARALAQHTTSRCGYLDVCTSCDYEQSAYNSCRNRHCPKCQSLAQARWIDKRLERLLPVHYFHVVFTLPSELRAVARKRFLFPVRVMGALFRGKMLAALERAHARGDIDLGDVDLRALRSKAWIVYAKRPFGGPEHVIRYLGRYTHSIGISNQRLVSMDERGVTFRTKEGKTVTLSGYEMFARFVQHVLPPRFIKIRHYGLHASSNAKKRLERARRSLELTAVSREHEVVARRAGQILLRDLDSRNGVFLGEQRLTPQRDVVWRSPTMARIGGTLLGLDEPVNMALAELEAAAGEAMREEDIPPPPVTVGIGPGSAPASSTPFEAPESSQMASMGAAPIAEIAADTTEMPRVSRRKMGWTTTDFVVVTLALLVIGVSLAGLVWVLR